MLNPGAKCLDAPFSQPDQPGAGQSVSMKCRGRLWPDALDLMANIVIAWRYLTDAGGAGSLVELPPVIPPERSGRLRPTRLESINLRGVFRFPVDRYADQIPPRGQMHR